MPPGEGMDSGKRVDEREEPSWEEYLYVGENGLLTILVTLRWWWDEINELDKPIGHVEWMLALVDVYSAIERVSSALRYAIFL